MDRRRRPTPVQIVHFPAKAKRRATQTVPEVRTVTEEMPTEPIRMADLHRAITLRDHQVVDVTRGMEQLAALGHSLFSQGRVEESRAIFEGLVAARPHDSFAHTMLGTIYLALNVTDRALALFEAALQLDSNDIAALVYRGELRFKGRRYKRSIEDFKLAIALGEDDDPFVERARRLLKLARRHERERATQRR